MYGGATMQSPRERELERALSDLVQAVKHVDRCTLCLHHENAVESCHTEEWDTAMAKAVRLLASSPN